MQAIGHVILALGHVGTLQCMLRNAHGGIHGLVAEVGHNEHHLAELGELAAVLEKEGLGSAAEKARLAAAGYEKANALLGEAYERCARGED